MSHVHFLLRSVITNYALTWCEIFLKDADVADHIDIDIDIDISIDYEYDIDCEYDDNDISINHH